MKKIILLLSLSFTISASAQSTISLETQDLLIKKLTNVFLKLPEGQKAKLKVTLRLADLHAERGRMVAKKELEKGCLECTNGEPDRKKALEYYQYALPKMTPAQKQEVLVQVGHLYEVLGRTDEAIKFYKQTIAAAAGTDSLSEAQFSLAEIYFKKRDYRRAKGYYEKALSQQKFSRRGLAEYRIAWCDYNDGSVGAATRRIEKILTTPDLLTRSSQELKSRDEDFQGEVAKDYTVFVAHSGKITLPVIERVYKLSPVSTRLENVTYLAKELERLGQIKPAIGAWEMVVAKTEKPMDRMEALIYLAGVELKNKNMPKVFNHLQRAHRNRTSLGSCDNEQCKELEKRFRGIVLDWNRMEKKAPSEDLQKAYEIYLSMVKQDPEALNLAMQVAFLRKDYKAAGAMNQKLINHHLAAAKPDANQLEDHLLKQIEIAELVKDAEALTQAQDNYLNKSLLKSKESEIRYNVAQKLYDDKSYKEASDKFYQLALNRKTPENIAFQSAEMAIDSLVLLKNDQQIEAWSTEFAVRFPKQAGRFNQINRKAVLSQTAKLVTPPVGAAAAAGAAVGLEAAWATLSRFNISAANQEEKITYYRNRIILARKLRKYDEMRAAVNEILAIKGLSPEDQKFALENKVFVSELQLDFNSALTSYRRLNQDNWLELARLADLAETKSKPFYIKYLKGQAKQELALGICDRLVREQGNFLGELKVCLPYLAKDKALFSELFLYTYTAKPNLDRGLGFVKKHGLADTAAGRILAREKTLKNSQRTLSRLQKHKLDGRTSRVARSIKTRASRLTAFERVVAQASEAQDWYLQVIFLTELQKEYDRFYKELLALPVPQELTDEEKQQYLTLLSQQASPYKAQADEIGLKVTELWQQDKAIDQLLADFHRANFKLQKILGPQLERVKKILPESAQGKFFLVYKESPVKKLPSLAVLETARQQVKRDPYDKSALSRLIQLERARGHRPMVLYLESRLAKIDRGFESLN